MIEAAAAVAVAAIAAAYLLGSIPVAYLVGRVAGDVDIRERGSGNVGASNIWQSVSKTLVVPVGLAQIAQGFGAVAIAWLLGCGQGVQAACGVAAVLANDWNPWLRFSGGRGIGATIGVLLAVSPYGLAVFIVIACIGIPRAVPVTVALGLAMTPLITAGAIAAGIDNSWWDVAACGALAAVALAKRLLANGPPAPEAPRPDVWRNRLLLDRDIADRETWVHREPTTVDRRP